MSSRPFASVNRGITMASQGLAMVGFALLITFAAATAVDVLARWLFNSPIRGLSDWGTLVMIVAVTAGMPANMIKRQNVTIEMLGNVGEALFGWRWPAMLDALGAVVTLGFIGLLAWRLVLFAQSMSETSETTLILQLPLAPWWGVGAVFAVVAALAQVMVVGRVVLYCVVGGEED
jgi:TRAP-type C4-dicarboxylate transport system permease small subunit